MIFWLICIIIIQLIIIGLLSYKVFYYSFIHSQDKVDLYNRLLLLIHMNNDLNNHIERMALKKYDFPLNTILD